MRSFVEYLQESTSPTMIRPGLLENYIKLFFTMLSKATKAYKKSADYNSFIDGCGRIYDENTKDKVVTTRPFYKLSSQIGIHYNKIFYTLELDTDSSNVILMYRDYKDSDKRELYQMIMTAKNNIIDTLKTAGFSVKNSRTTIYASIPNYVMNPDSENGLVSVNSYQEGLLKIAKKLFKFEGVKPAYNRYAITLLKATPIKEIESIPVQQYEKVVLTTNGKIVFYDGENSEGLTVQNAFDVVRG